MLRLLLVLLVAVPVSARSINWPHIPALADEAVLNGFSEVNRMRLNSEPSFEPVRRELAALEARGYQIARLKQSVPTYEFDLVAPNRSPVRFSALEPYPGAPLQVSGAGVSRLERPSRGGSTVLGERTPEGQFVPTAERLPDGTVHPFTAGSGVLGVESDTTAGSLAKAVEKPGLLSRILNGARGAFGALLRSIH